MAFSGAQGVLRVGVCPSVRCTYTCRRSRVRDCSRGGERDAESESEEREKGGEEEEETLQPCPLIVL